MEYALVVENLEKSYGRYEAVKGISFNIKPGEIFALIGPNGAGKTSTLRMIATILSPTSGDAAVYGTSIVHHPKKVRELISYLPEEAGAYKNLTGYGYLNFMAALFSSGTSQQKQYVNCACEISGLDRRLSDKIGTYSKGMTRKLLLARAVMTNPRLAILDEPTSGLDVINALEIRRVIKELAKTGMSVLVSSHNMLEIEFLSDRMAIIDKGILHKTGTASEMKAELGKQNLEEVFVEVVK